MQQVYIVSSQNNNNNNNYNNSSQAYSIGQSSPPITTINNNNNSNSNNVYGYTNSTNSTTIYPQNIQVQVRTQNGTGVVGVNGGNYIIQDQRGHWRDGLCDCFSNIFPSCAMSFFFQCVILGQISENLNFAPCGFICCGYVGIWILFLILTLYIFGLQWIIWVCIAFLIWGLRNQLRTTQRIPGNSLEDCFVSFFCQGCAIAQMARHLFQYREVCDEISCSNDGRPSYFNQLNQNQNHITGTSGYTPTWQQSQHQPQQIYVHPQQPQYATSYTPQYIQPQGVPISVSTSGHGSSISKPGWQDNVGGAATPYNQQNSGIINPSSITITTAAPAPQYPTIVVAQPVPQLTHTPIRYQEEDAPV